MTAGPGTAKSELPLILSQLGARRPLVVTDRGLGESLPRVRSGRGMLRDGLNGFSQDA